MRRRIIFTTFAGRQSCMSILMKYVTHLKNAGLIDEFHAWNFTRDASDDAWLRRTLEHDQHTIVTYGYRYHELVNATFPLKLEFVTSSDAHILLHDDQDDIAEIVLGGWNNQVCAIRPKRQSPQHVASWKQSIDPSKKQHVTIEAIETSIKVTFNGTEQILQTRPFDRLRVSLSSFDNLECTWTVSAHSWQRLIHVSNKKSWSEYYKHYTQEQYPNSIIIKSDDDIVFIHPGSFYRFTQFVQNDLGNCLMAFPNIINNGVCAHLLQRHGILHEAMFGPLPYDTFQGRLWEDGKLCQTIHKYFVENHMTVIKSTSELPAIALPEGSRISINFFAVRSEDLAVTFGACGEDDEQYLSIQATSASKRSHVVYQPFVVSHLSFYKQRETGLDYDACVDMYKTLAEKMFPCHAFV